MTLYESYEIFMTEQQFRNNTDKTLEWYRTSLQKFIAWCADELQLSDITIQVYKQYVIYLQQEMKSNGEPLSSSSVSNRARAVKAFINYWIEEEQLPDFSRKLKIPKVHFEEKQILSDNEVFKLLSCFGCSQTELRNQCWCLLMLDSGLRKSEVLKIKISDVNFNDNSILINGKGRKQRFIPLGSQSAQLLRHYFQRYRTSAQSNDYFFVDRFGNQCSDNLIKQMFQKLKRRSGIERLHAHLLRHTFATMYLVDGGDLESLRLILGHSDIQITQVYLHMASNYKLINQRHLSHYDKIIGVS